MTENDNQIPGALGGSDAFAGADAAPRVPYNGPTAPAGQPQDVAAPYSASGILGGTGLESMVSGYLQHITQVQANSPLGQKNKAIQDAKAAQSAAPVDTTKPATDPDAPAPAPAGGDQPRPGSFGGKLSSAVGEVAAGFGDAAHASDTKGGWLSGVANTLNARNQRLAQAKKDDILMAKTQAETVALHRNAFRQSQEDAAEFHKGNQHFQDIMDLNHNNVEASFDEVQKKMKDPKFALNHYVREIASDPMSDADGKPKRDKFGDPVTTPRYTIIDKATKDGAPDDHVVDANMSAHMEQFYGTKMPVGTKLTTGQFVAMDTTMQADRMAVNHLNNGREKPLSADEIKTLRPALTDPTIQAAISHKPGDPYGGVQEQIANGNAHVAEYQKQMADAQAQKNQPAYDWAKSQLQDVQEEHEKLKQFAADAFTEKQVTAYEKKQDEGQDLAKKALEKPSLMEGNTSAYKAVFTKQMNDPNGSPQSQKQAKDMLGIIDDIQKDEVTQSNAKAAGKKTAETGFEGDPKALSPEAFMASLKPDEQNLVSMIGTGKMALKRLDYLATKHPEILEAVAKSYPDFDSSKIESYGTTYKDFTSGKTSVNLNAGGTAMGHLAELRDLNTAASHIPHTPSWTAYQNKADTLATELAKFYGDATIPAIAAIKETLTSTLPGNREAAITTQAQSMGDKLEAFEQTWKNAAPSKAYEAPLPFISTQAKKAFASLNPDYAAAHPEYAPKSKDKPAATQAGPKSDLPPGVQDNEHNRPKGTTGFKQGSDKKWYYMDINNKPLAPMPGQ
jgi:hypothetical protein